MTEKPVTVFHSPPQMYCSEPGCPCSLPMPPVRRAVVPNADAQVVRSYLYSNYTVVASDADTVTIEGHDYADFTLDAILTRMGSGLIFGKEIS